MKIKYIIETSTWIKYLQGSSEKIKKLIDSESIVTTVIAISELSDYCARNKIDYAKVLRLIRRRCEVYPITFSVTEAVGKLKLNQRKTFSKFGLADALQYTIAKELDAKLVTCDNDFRGLKHTLVV